jgi:hypothetical protein
MTLEKIAGEIRIAVQGVEARTGGKIAIHVRVVREQAVGQAAGGDFAQGIQDFRDAIFVNIVPPRLRVADEGDGRKFFEDFMKALNVRVVFVVLKMQEDGNAVVARNFSDLLDGGRVAIHREFLFADAQRALLEPAFDFRARARQAGDFIGEAALFAGMFFHKIIRRLVAGDVGIQPVKRAGGQQDGFGDAHGLLVGEQVFVGAEAVIGMLMNVYDGFGRRRGRIGRAGCRRQQQHGGSGKKLPARKGTGRWHRIIHARVDDGPILRQRAGHLKREKRVSLKLGISQHGSW